MVLLFASPLIVALMAEAIAIWAPILWVGHFKSTSLADGLSWIVSENTIFSETPSSLFSISEHLRAQSDNGWILEYNNPRGMGRDEHLVIAKSFGFSYSSLDMHFSGEGPLARSTEISAGIPWPCLKARCWEVYGGPVLGFEPTQLHGLIPVKQYVSFSNQPAPFRGIITSVDWKYLVADSAAFLLCLYLISWTAHIVVVRARLKKNRCIECGYPTKDPLLERCPECGTPKKRQNI